ncbi:hypothetical protein MUGA111182_00245 [Mucilaginibacter galii]|uniref:KTSC domain-containing protein n=1 Tax=Mucilaginibacter galii TaxID=2005073 RepID=A0A917N1K2_9SPHI|nr:hypothetical protein [Mucilaginibacter galii]GGI49117.1 hypothetical protein GCM10011425_03290 [Mucilaginibacter galii]
MTPYKNLSTDSGVTAYEIKVDSIVVEFKSGDKYLYSYDTPGKDAVEAIKILATKGVGLSTYISKDIKGRYAAKL